MSLKKIIQAAAICAGLIGLGGGASASVITFHNVNDTGSILYSTTQDGATLSATMQFTLSAISNNSATFALTVSNNSSGPGANQLMSFGVDTVSPTLTGASATGSWEAGINKTLPTFQTVDLCIWRSNGCPGGAVGDGLAEGLSDMFSLVLTTAGNFLQPDGISFTSPYGVKFQNVGTAGSAAEFAGCIAGTAGCGPTTRQLPEPASIALVGLGLLGVALGRRRRA
ncbi:PEP-CTERM protein-sorting domain-containing protein [Polaromonas sp. OV174]|uniref:cistern family PEP-CTERM protein n=1 Tax=Polaromonas sp. OV174 TaxID=1855300 RepID=UPI0008E489F3|nr:cistern family PEP-CTERM protein [Polaromonas sp. OV174]SFC10504.1 PEP-CTERM protein-sorting domain-containing protein [Polaromonas sp. OV174]